MQAASIHVNRLKASYQLPRSQAGSSLTIQRRLDRVASELLIRKLETEFELIGLRSDGFYFIEELKLNLALDLKDGDDALAKVWARALNESICRHLVSGQDGLIAFRDRAAFLTGLIEDLLKGAPWNWYHEEFAGLRSLPTGQAILKLLTEDSDQGREILLELATRNQLNLLFASLTDSEAEHVINVCLLPESPSFIPAGAYQRWTAALRELFSDQFRLQSRFAPDVARLYLALLQKKPELGPDVNLARFVRDLLRLRQVMIRLANDPQILSLIETEDVGGCRDLLGAGESMTLLQDLIRNCGGPETAALLRETDQSTEILEQFVTDFGGIFLLAPAIMELKADDDISENCPYPKPQFGSLRSWLFYLIARQCLGPDASPESNRVLTALAGLPRAPTKDSVAEYAATLTAVMHRQFAEVIASVAQPLEHAADPWFTLGHESKSNDARSDLDRALAPLSCAVLYRFASKLGAFADSSPAYLYLNFLAARARVEITTRRIRVHFLSCPLQMVLRMAGFDNHDWRVSWLENKTLAFTFD